MGEVTPELWTRTEGVQDRVVSNDLNTLLTALYVLIDDHVVPPRTGRGRRPELTDSELICLAVAQALLGYHNERRWIDRDGLRSVLHHGQIIRNLSSPGRSSNRLRYVPAFHDGHHV